MRSGAGADSPWPLPHDPSRRAPEAIRCISRGSGSLLPAPANGLGARRRAGQPYPKSLPSPTSTKDSTMHMRLSHLLAAILSGLLLAAAFPKWDQTYLLIFALVPLLWALQGQSLKAAFWLGLVSGLAHYVAHALLDRLRHPRLREAAPDRRHRHPAPAGRVFMSLHRGVGAGGRLGRRPGPQSALVGARPLGGPGDGANLHHQRLPLGAAGQRPLPATRGCSSSPISPGCTACRSWWSW